MRPRPPGRSRCAAATRRLWLLERVERARVRRRPAVAVDQRVTLAVLQVRALDGARETAGRPAGSSDQLDVAEIRGVRCGPLPAQQPQCPQLLVRQAVAEELLRVRRALRGSPGACGWRTPPPPAGPPARS